MRVLHLGNRRTPEHKWLMRDQDSLEISCPPGSKWIKLNVGQFGFYRVNYFPLDWGALIQALEDDPNSLPPMDRASLLNDAFSLADASILSYGIPLKMTTYLSKETHLVPWQTVSDKLGSLGNLLESCPIYPKFKEFVVKLVAKHYHRVGWEVEGTHVEKLLRVTILSLACNNGLDLCRQEAAKLFSSWISDQNFYLHPDIRSLVYMYGMKSSSDWDTTLQRYKQEINAQEKDKLLRGLASIEDSAVLERFITLAKDETLIRSQDYLTTLTYISWNPTGNPLVWKYIQDEWPALVERFGLNDRYLGRLPKTVTEGFTTEDQLNQVKKFFSANPEAGAGARARRQALENIEINIKWQDHSYKKVAEWIEKNEFV